MKRTKNINLKSNQGFTMQDLAVAIIILILFAGTIGGIYVSILTVQAETKIDAVVTVYAMQILEDIDRIDYEDVTNGMEESYRTKFKIPSSMTLNINVTNYEPETNSEDIIKNIKVTIDYSFRGKTKQFVIENIKVKEV